MNGLNLSSLPSPTERYEKVSKLGGGVFGNVWLATDSQAAGKSVAVKIQTYCDENEAHIQNEYAILRDYTNHINIIDFYGVFCERIEEVKNIWFVLELCECGSLIDIVRKLHATDRKMSEEHISYILKYTIKAISYMHENNVMCRNIRCSNILLTKDGEIKLSDFGLCCKLSDPSDTTNVVIGPPGWMAPEVAAMTTDGYGFKADVWAVGITTIEMADGRGPFEDMHPTRALFQIKANPPPGLRKPAMWSNDLNDFIAECLEKNPEHRPFVMELEEHPFIQSVPEHDYFLSTEIKKLQQDLKGVEVSEPKMPERLLKDGLLVMQGHNEAEVMQVEDLAALDNLTEENILCELQTKMAKGAFTSFVGDILLILNSNTNDDIYNETYHQKYECKSRSDNEPHIFAIADSAYQDALHHNEAQHIVFSGESKSGKTTNMNHALAHLTHLGAMKNNTAERIRRAATCIQAAISASTPVNPHSTRAIFQTQVTYGKSGKLSGVIFWLYQLEKWRVSSTDMTHANFNLIYYFYDAMAAENKLENLFLENNRRHRYLRVLDESIKGITGARETQKENVQLYKDFIDNLNMLDWDQADIDTFEKVLAAILVLGNVRFKDGKFGAADVENPKEAVKVAQLLSLDESKYLWSLLNYCLIEKGSAVKRKHTTDEARDARDTLAGALYKRLIEWMINLINFKLSFGRAVFGDKFTVSLLDMFGFECFHRNRIEQLIVNTTNEQIQFVYNQKVFAWEMQEQAEEGLPVVGLHFYDNKIAVDHLMGRPKGLLYILDEASRTGSGQEFIMSTLKTSSKGPYIKLSGSHEFSIAHYTGRVNYDAREMADKNKDFLPPEMIETMRLSTNETVQELFKNKFTKTGNLTSTSVQPYEPAKTKSDKESANLKAKKYNTVSKGQFSQLRRMRTVAATYRATTLELIKQLSAVNCGTNFVRCIRPDLNDNPRGFQTEVVRQQLRALAILDTAKARQSGYPCRIPFAEFIKRYRFLAFDFDETVEVNTENVRLLLIRLKMEGWVIGKTKVFLKYYNEEFLARLYEVQIKKIVKVQCMMRTFMARRNASKNKSKVLHIKELKKQKTLTADEDEAALLIQKAYRGYVVRKANDPLINKATGKIDEATATFLKKFTKKWKSRSIFQVLLQFRAIRYQDLVHFSQQIHMYNQAIVEALNTTNTSVDLNKINKATTVEEFLGTRPATVWKLPFRMDQIQYYDTTAMIDPVPKNTNDTFDSQNDSDNEQWDAPLRRKFKSEEPVMISASTQTTLINIPFCRDPTQPVQKLPAESDIKQSSTSRNSRPTVYKRKPNASPQPYYQPPSPWAQDDTDVLENSAPRPRKSINPLGMYGVNYDVQDPVEELQALARSANDISDDAPPFDFQSMLRKTPRNRASMKRSGEMEFSVYDESSKPSPVRSQKSTIKSHKKVPAPSPPTQRSQSRDFVRKDSRDLIKGALMKRASNDALQCPVQDSKKECKKIELVPGITVEGTEFDL